MFITNFDLAQGYFDVGSKADFWDYVQETLIPQTFRTVDYNGGDVAEDDTRFLDNGYFLRLGPPSLRQFRVPKGRFMDSTRSRPYSCEVDVSLRI